ncbi:unnamed protein product [Rhizoctonia solani]|uniref:Uncharacterized protein n=1 Tax=Rhizoctonia solani TaxID=456999 RepID=A0A8H3C395_9AGAM|nr:unnamed protein product [Rhizoctonia solani]
MGLTRTPPQVVYPRSTLMTPTPQGGPSTQPHPTSSLSTPRVSSQQPIQQSPEDPVTPVKAEKRVDSSSGPSSNNLQHFPASARSSNGVGFTPLSARVTPIAAARPIIAPSENGPLNAHINSLNKQLVELEALKKDLSARLADSGKKLDSETARRDRTIRDLTIQHEKEKQEWKDTLNAVQIVHNIAHQRARHELEQERLNYFNSESRILQQNVRILVRDHSLTRFQVHEAQVGKESASYQDQLMDTKEELEELQRMLEQTTESYEKELVDQKESIKTLKQQLEHERKSRGSIENGRESLESINAALISDLERVRKELAAAQSRIKDLQNGVTDAKSTQKSLEKAKSKHESELEQLNDEINSLNEEKKAAQERIDELAKHNRALEKERDKRIKAEVDYKAMQKQVSELEEGRSKEVKKLEAEFKKTIKELESKVHRYQAEAREAQEAVQASEMRANTLEKRLASAKEVKPTQSAFVSSKGKGKEKQPSEDPEDANSKSSDRAVEELVFTDPSEDEEDVEVFAPPSQPKAQPKGKPPSSNPPASTSERSKPRPKMRPPPPPKSPSPSPPKSKTTAPEVVEIDDEDEEEAAPVKTKPRAKPRPPPSPSPPSVAKPASKPKANGKGKQTVIIDDDDEPEIPPVKSKSRAQAKEKAPAKDKEKAKAKTKETNGASNSKRPLDEELDTAEATGEKKKKKRKLFGAENADFNWGAGPGHLDTLGIPTSLSPIRDKGDKIPRHRRV